MRGDVRKRRYPGKSYWTTLEATRIEVFEGEGATPGTPSRELAQRRATGQGLAQPGGTLFRIDRTDRARARKGAS